MSKKQFKSQASSSRAFSSTFGGQHESFGGVGLGAALSFGSISSSSLSYIYEPPDLSQISDSGAVVAFKNLQKKDSTTKTKALEGLQNVIKSLTLEKKEVEEGILQAWIRIFPRTSIDNEPRVRQLAHTLQGQISIACGKRIAKPMPLLVGPWLAGIFDSDKRAMRAASNSFVQVFPSEEKQKNVWRVYQSSIITYCRDAILKESTRSLSDERTTSPDDAKAKHARVIGGALLLIAKLLSTLSSEDIDKEYLSYEELLRHDQLWKMTVYNDSFVRRAVYRLLVIVIDKMERALDLKMISSHLLLGGLCIDQTGSSFEYARTLARTTISFPELWTSYYRSAGKKTANNQLCEFLRRGSQGGPPDFWVQVRKLLESVPFELVTSDWDPLDGSPADTEPVIPPVILALRDGITRKDEHESGQLEAWLSFLRATELLLLRQELPYDRVGLFVRDTLLAIIEQYIRPNPKTIVWTTMGPDQQEICIAAAALTVNTSLEAFEQNWPHISEAIVEDFQSSLLEQSRDYLKSQDAIIDEISRWYRLQAEILSGNVPDAIRSTIESTSLTQINAAIKSLTTRYGKPYSCMAVLIFAIQEVPEVTVQKGNTKSVLVEFAERGVIDLLTSPSLKLIMTFLDEMERGGHAKGVREVAIDAILDTSESVGKIKSLEMLFGSHWLGDGSISRQLLALAKDKFQNYLQGNPKYWVLCSTSIENPATPPSLITYYLEKITGSLLSQDHAENALDALDHIFKQKNEDLGSFILSPTGPTLLSRLLDLATDAKIPKAQKLNSTLYSYISGDAVLRKSVKDDYLITMINNLSVDDKANDPRETHAAVACNSKAYRTFAASPEGFALLSRVMVLTNTLSRDDPLDANLPASAFRTLVTSSDRELGKFYSLAEQQMRDSKYKDPNEAGTEPTDEQGKRADAKGNNTYLSGFQWKLPVDWRAESLQHGELRDQVVYYYNLIGNIMYSSISNIEAGQRPTNPDYGNLTRRILSISPRNEPYVPLDGQIHLELVRSCPELVVSTAVLSEHLQATNLSRICNSYIANVTGLNFQRGSEALRQLMILNGLLLGRSDVLSDTPQPRMVFFVKHIVAALQDRIYSRQTAVEIMQVLTQTLVNIKDVYGSFWTDLFDIIMSIWSWQPDILSAQLSTVYSSMQLFCTLRKLSLEGSNDDLQDIYNERKEQIFYSLLGLLKYQSDMDDKDYQCQETFNILLANAMNGLEPPHAIDVRDIYPTLASESPVLQQAAYQLLKEIIPKTQEELSIEIALSKDSNVKLPEELLSLVLASPMSLETDVFNVQESMPPALRSYLLSWKLVFVHWTNASYKLQTHYADSLKEGQYLDLLLEYAFEFLIGSRPRPIDASKHDFTQFDTDMYESPEEETSWFLIHLCYLCMTNIPMLTKTWWRDHCPRQLQRRVEDWVEKYISSAVIQNEFATVQSWIPTQDTSEEPLEIKVSTKAREITASFPVDDQFIAIAIRLPAAYPLHPVSVETVNRVGVDEKKWRSWLITTQGVINFSSSRGSLIDGLVAWKRKVIGTLKNQSECAICFSVVSGDKQLPSKQCGTCRKLFHSSCLFRWFKSSNSSSCPLCRNPFNYA